MKKKKISKVNSQVESIALKQSGQQRIYPPTEKISTIIVENFPALGKLTAMRFLEWAQQNEGWTVSLPTGKTPEHFIRWVTHLLQTWQDKKTQKLLEESGVDPARKPDMS
ncbi:MAG TPA: glucosamine-6-phosphate deaminase, partial [Calditrichaeota bacterium]|nr:glucosamine-6-phosphate deaminase [Calditrichota bacterium]